MADLVWSRYQATRSDGSLVKLRIQDCPENRIEDAVDLYIKYFIYEEAFPKAAGIAQNPHAIAEAQRLLTESMKDPAYRTMVCCVDQYEDRVGKIIGVSSTYLSTVGSKPFEGIKLETKEMQLFFNLMDGLSNFHERMQQRFTNFYDDRDMVVHPEFRRLGIGTEFIKARRLACIAHNVDATGALMTSSSITKAAHADNWDTLFEVNLDDLGRQHGVSFPDGGVRKFMIWVNPRVKNHEKLELEQM